MSLGNWHFDVEGAPDEFADFILAHALKELELGYGDYDEYAMTFDDGSWKLGPDSLPHLRSFKGHASAFREMTEARVGSLKTLKRLDVGPGGVDDPVYELQRMLDALDDWQAETGPGSVLVGLKELRLNLVEWDERMHGHILHAIDRCAQNWGPTLEVWLGDIYTTVNQDALCTALAKFEKLRVVHIRERVLASTKADEFALKIAVKCLMLEEVVVTDLDFPRHGVTVSIRIARDGNAPRVAYTVEL